MRQRKRRGCLPTVDGKARWEAAFKEIGKTLSRICSEFDDSNVPPGWKRRWEEVLRETGTMTSKKAQRRFAPNLSALRHFRDGDPLEEPTFLLVYFAVGLNPVKDVDYEIAAPIVVPEAPSRQVGAYVARPDLEGRILERIEFKLSKSDLTPGVILSIEGGPGSGKTRLALEILRQVSNRALRTGFLSFENISVYPGELAEERALDAFLDRFANSLAHGGRRPTAGAFADRLKGERMLLVLDKLETVACKTVDAALKEMVLQAPGLIVLGTSQLRIEADFRFDLSNGMQLEEAEQLLRNRMLEVLPPDAAARNLDRQKLRELVKACWLIPAAIEDVASLARTPIQPIRVLEELKKIHSGVPDHGDLTSRFASVRAGASLWAYREIARWGGPDAPAIQRAFRFCGAFGGPFTDEEFDAVAGKRQSHWLTLLQNAYAVTADTQAGLWTQNPFRRGIAKRLLEETGELPEAEQKFFDYFFRLLLREGPKLGQAVCDWNLLRRTVPNWIQACYHLGDRVAAGDLAAADQFHHARSAMQNTGWYLGWDIAPLLTRVGRAAEAIGAKACQADCARGLGWVNLCFRSNQGVATAWYQKALELYTELQDLEGQADALRCLADCGFNLDVPTRILYLERALNIVPEDCLLERAWMERSMGALLHSTGSGTERLEKARNVFFALGRFADVACCDMDLAEVRVKAGDLADGMRLRTSALGMARESGDVRLHLNVILRGLDWQVDQHALSPYLDPVIARAELEEACEVSARYQDQRILAAIQYHLAVQSDSPSVAEAHLSEAEILAQRAQDWYRLDACRRRRLSLGLGRRSAQGEGV